MWDEITRGQYRRDGLRYASDTTDAEWTVIEPFMRRHTAVPIGGGSYSLAQTLPLIEVGGRSHMISVRTASTPHRGPRHNDSFVKKERTQHDL
jgi:hypothetical protein